MAGGGFFDRLWVKVVAVVFSAVVGLAGVGSLWLSWHERQRPPTSAGWTSAALAVCERHTHEIRVPMRDAMTRLTSAYAAISSTTAALQSAGPHDTTAVLSTLRGVAVDMHAVAAATEDSGDALSAVVGDFRSLPAPPASRAGIDRLIATGKRLSGEFSDIAGSTRSIATALDRLDPQDLAASAPAIAQLTVEMPRVTTAIQGTRGTVADWNAELAALRIGSCLPAMSGFALTTPTTTISPTVPPTTVPPSTSRTGFDAAESALLGMLADDEFGTCSANADAESADVPAALNCTTVRAGPVRRPLVARAAGSDALRRVAQNEAAGVTSASCRDGLSYVGTWHNSTDAVQGTLICKFQDGLFRMWWSYESDDVYMIAEAPDPATLYGWWSDGYFLDRT